MTCPVGWGSGAALGNQGWSSSFAGTSAPVAAVAMPNRNPVRKQVTDAIAVPLRIVRSSGVPAHDLTHWARGCSAVSHTRYACAPVQFRLVRDYAKPME